MPRRTARAIGNPAERTGGCAATSIRRAVLLSLSSIAPALWLAGAPASAQEVVKIGYSGPLSGGAALYGKNVLDGMQMAAGEINASGLEVGGRKYKLEIVAFDDKYNPSETAINAQRLVQEHKTPAILVPHSGGSFAVQTTNEQQKYLLLSYTSVPQVTARGNKLTFRIPPEFTAYVKPFVNYTMNKYGKNLAIANADHDYAKAWTATFKPAWEAAGGKVVAENPMSYNRATDFYSGVSRVLAAKPDVLFIGGASEPTALVVRQARELGFKGGFAIIDQAKMDEIVAVGKL
jgi:branched-chain amino acid transport system substrate-binding protein